jgi:hypothetical protein
LEVVEALLELDHGKSLRERKRARHRASGYMIEGGKLWRVTNGRSVCAEARLECIPKGGGKGNGMGDAPEPWSLRPRHDQGATYDQDLQSAVGQVNNGGDHWMRSLQEFWSCAHPLLARADHKKASFRATGV